MKAKEPLEIEIQSGFRSRLRYVAPGVSLVAIPNGGKRGPKAIRAAKREGMASGFPDVICIWRGGLCFIEFKRPSGKLTDNQAEWLMRLDDWGFQTSVCRTVEDAILFLRNCGAPMMDSRNAA